MSENGFQATLANLGSITEGVVSEAKGSGDLPSDQGNKGPLPPINNGTKLGTSESMDSQLERLLARDEDDENGEDALTKRGKGAKGPAKAAKLNLEGKAANPKASKAQGEEQDGEGDEDEDGEAAAKAAEAEVARQIRKLKRYGQEIELDTSDPNSALEKLMGMAGDDAEVSVVIDGQEYRVPQGELMNGYMRAAGANKKFAEAQQLRQQFEQGVQAFRHNPAALLRQLQIEPMQDDGLIVEILEAIGITDPIEWAGKYAWTEVERRSMQNPTAQNYDPQKYVRTQLDMERRMDAQRQAREQRAQQALYQQQQQQAQQQQFQQQLQSFTNALPAALERAGLPSNDLVNRVTWDLYREAMRVGASVTPDQLASDAREWLEDNVRGTYGKSRPKDFRRVFSDEPIKATLMEMAADGDALLDYLPKEVIQAIRKADTRRLATRNRKPREDSVTSAPGNANGGARAGKTMGTREAQDLIRSGLF